MKRKNNKKSSKKVLTIGIGFDIIAELSERNTAERESEELRSKEEQQGMHLEN